MKLLIVEDERKTASYLRKGLTENGFAEDVAAGDDGLRLSPAGGLVVRDRIGLSWATPRIE
jgi:two-component system copper resistance phosphate regulon response regulator CusR